MALLVSGLGFLVLGPVDTVAALYCVAASHDPPEVHVSGNGCVQTVIDNARIVVNAINQIIKYNICDHDIVRPCPLIPYP